MLTKESGQGDFFHLFAISSLDKIIKASTFPVGNGKCFK